MLQKTSKPFSDRTNIQKSSDKNLRQATKKEEEKQADQSTMVMTAQTNSQSKILEMLGLEEKKDEIYLRLKHLDTETNLKNYFPKLSKNQMRELMFQDRAYGLILNPYKKLNRLLSADQRAKIIQTLVAVQHQALMSDFALLLGIYMFDKVMEGKTLSSTSGSIVNREFKLAAICLFLAAKLEDAKYPYFDCYLKVLLDKTSNNREFNEQIMSFKNKGEYATIGQSLLDMELLIFEQLKRRLDMPVSLKFYDRFARVAFADSKDPELDYQLGLYLLFIAVLYPKIQFDYHQALIAACTVHIVLRIRDSEWVWSDYLSNEIAFGQYSEVSLAECSAKIIKKYVGLCEGKNPKYKERLWIIQNKFLASAHLRVANVRPKKAEPH